jgi:hypothetical protein
VSSIGSTTWTRARRDLAAADWFDKPIADDAGDGGVLPVPAAGLEVTVRAPSDRVIPTISPAVTLTRSTAPAVMSGRDSDRS